MLAFTERRLQDGLIARWSGICFLPKDVVFWCEFRFNLSETVRQVNQSWICNQVVKTKDKLINKNNYLINIVTTKNVPCTRVALFWMIMHSFSVYIEMSGRKKQNRDEIDRNSTCSQRSDDQYLLKPLNVSCANVYFWGQIQSNINQVYVTIKQLCVFLMKRVELVLH